MAPVVWNTAAFPSSTWVHVALTFDGATNRYALYQNAQLVATAMAANAPVNHAGISVGPYNNGARWNGYIDHATLWNAVLTPAQIVDAHAGTCTVSAPSMPPAVKAFPNDGKVLVSWAAPPDNGSSITDHIIEYQASADTVWVRPSSDDVHTPPRAPWVSNNRTLAPARAAVIAALTPAGPAPQTMTSASWINGMSRDASRTRPTAGGPSPFVVLPSSAWANEARPRVMPAPSHSRREMRRKRGGAWDFSLVGSWRHFRTTDRRVQRSVFV